VGLPPEQHADRVVAAMLRWIAAEHAGTIDRIKDALKDMRGGNPVAQQRMVDRILKVGGPTIIAAELVSPGKRGRFRIRFLDWCVYSPERDREVRPGDPIPAKPWLSVNRSIWVCEGGGVQTGDSYYSLLIAHHALSRLAQRCGARTIDDLLAATKALWVGYRAWRKTLPKNEMPEEGRFPIDLPNSMAAATACVRRREGVNSPLIATIHQ
jgi:hypothetical protein